jgi:muramoyltetrapeptide carboxypeptidase LdcA involved in peptidoglycan recycling
VRHGDEPFDLKPAPAWSDDPWFLDQEDRHLESGTDWWVLQEGAAAGPIAGGNLCTLNLLQGTSYLPAPDGAVVFAEDDACSKPWDFDRDLVSLLQQPGFGGVTGLVIGRFRGKPVHRATCSRRSSRPSPSWRACR